MENKYFEIGTAGASKKSIPVGLNQDMFVFAGPCVLESRQLCLGIARELVGISSRTGVSIAFKGSFDKANRTSVNSFRGPGMANGLEILDEVRNATGLPIVTDVHEPSQAEPVGKVVDCLQIPAFLCRQTDLLVACAKTGKPVNVKKGQFVSPSEMANAVGKLGSVGNEKIILTERGTFFGYNRLVNDMTSIEAMKSLGCPVMFDATHSTQQPGGFGDSSAGQRHLTPLLAKAAVAAGANALFFEVHPDPDNARCDAACMIPLDWLENIIVVCKVIFDTVKRYD